MKDIECPYCEYEFDICNDDGFGRKEGIKHHQECPACGKMFVFETSILFHYEPQKADCLNDGNHNWEPTRTYPKNFTQMQCTICGERRPPSKAEMEKILNTAV